MANSKEDDVAATRRINDALEDSGTNFQSEETDYRSKRALKSQLAPPFFRDKTDRSDPAVRRDLERGDMDYGPADRSNSGVGMGSYAKGGKVNKHGSPTCCGAPKYKDA